MLLGLLFAYLKNLPDSKGVDQPFSSAFPAEYEDYLNGVKEILTRSRRGTCIVLFPFPFLKMCCPSLPDVCLCFLCLVLLSDFRSWVEGVLAAAGGADSDPPIPVFTLPCPAECFVDDRWEQALAAAVSSQSFCVPFGIPSLFFSLLLCVCCLSGHRICSSSSRYFFCSFLRFASSSCSFFSSLLLLLLQLHRQVRMR